MKNRVSISIITATYNAAATIADCLESVNAQTVPVEHLIVDGASTDSTLEIVSRLNPAAHRLTPDDRLTRFTIHHSPFTGILSELDNGIYDAMNKGIRLATGDIVGILNADDFYADSAVLAKVAAIFADPMVEACYGDLEYIRTSSTFNVQRSTSCTKNPMPNDDGATSGVNTATIRGSTSGVKDSTLNVERRTLNDSVVVRYWKSGAFHPNKFYWGWMPPHPTFFVRRSVYEKFGLFRLDMGSAADYELMLRFLFRHRISASYIPEVLVKMRSGGVSNATLANRLRANRMDRLAWSVNGLTPHPWTLLLKPLRKLPQYLRQF